MKIGISCYPTLGGSGAVATELGKALAKRGHEVHFIVTDVPFRLGEYYENIYIHQSETASYPVLRTPPYDFALAALMADIAIDYELDVLHVHYALPFAVCAYLAKTMIGPRRLPVVTTLHGTDVTVLAQDRAMYSVIRLGIEQSDAVTAVSQSLIEQTRSVFQIDREIACVYNFVDPDVFHPMHRKHLREHVAPNGEHVLLHISNFRKVKRIPDVLRVFARVCEQIPSVLLLAGEGPEWAEARELAKSLNIMDKVHFLGRQDEVASLFSLADVLLLPSEKESFGLVALEAMASGVPVIGSTAGGIPELVTHGETGYLADVGDVERMAEYTLSILRDEGARARMSAASRARAVSHFHVSSKVAEYERIYESVIGTERT
ncbi:N-acetyl-alpha-D-glucosaminyl L-malate synthase BshA [Alicyclobacillus sp. ALC3]|uniref:N-acetyl-alpha-D-glucosaminyl L-malate synthase BshA n=1 Tax=Alicyclobacillus sp. ALC3 TaxID=2796143 RepID=UPI002379A384|nr:N-acetyl-alpha-D-glucosaminyl L-malate synthase BshA [Alicyclobacillus sp. ALC3]WDL97223.1 N-acetyl-alpha-D-glucosaminyl L-malate synthase BshA [Alicyclobacillus sp. ALC3]